jgi:translation initiation factor IF-3
VIDPDGHLLGILPTEEALAKARELELDLVEVSPNDKPPVCRIMDFGKFKYSQKKKKEKGHHHQSKLKELRVRPKTGDHDIGFKVNQAKQFLAHRDKVTISVVFRGRESAHMEEGRKVLDRIILDLAEVGKLDRPPQNEGKRITCTISPK